MMKYNYDIFCGSMGKKKYLLKQTGSMRRCFDGEYLGSDKTCETLATCISTKFKEQLIRLLVKKAFSYNRRQKGHHGCT